MDLGLERIQTLLRALNRPQDTFKVIHVAGTNGKGSVCAYMTSVLRQAGLSVGRFNSPHFLEPHDSIYVNDSPVSKQEYEATCAYVSKINNEQDISATSFEQLVATALCLFRDHQVEWIVIEVGLGGALDATNIFETPKMTIITSIGMDHAAVLGGTIQSIAAAKAGIMKSTCPVVIAPQNEPHALDTLIDHAKKVNAPFRIARAATWVKGASSSSTLTCRLDDTTTAKGTIEYSISLRGDYQRENSATAVMALLWLQENGDISFTMDMLQAGMARTRWPGRLDYIATPMFEGQPLPPMLVDGAHNIPAAKALRQYIDDLDPTRVLWLLGVTAGKDLSEMLSVLLRPDDTVLAAPFSQPQGMPWIHSTPPHEVCEHAMEIVSDARPLESVQAALKMIPSLESYSLVVLCGSLYLVADFYRLLENNNDA
ncbi:folylpolyglutamate synthase [Lichtheimia corymbifera JMRC:FSU:9682]|uniref:Dihydrofolate synthetase n=1 Tax=Lichtheimia corymbifera JMRC:FSU:9682 TaxID=1263082 RepID=A0A068RRP3_9FUNG|nr:folylpolyglutamate synthase [Lichtheimia corymbifera JMRC:FSU:9682]